MIYIIFRGALYIINISSVSALPAQYTDQYNCIAVSK